MGVGVVWSPTSDDDAVTMALLERGFIHQCRLISGWQLPSTECTVYFINKYLSISV